MEQFINTETLIIELLLIASLVAIAVRRFRIPYTVALVVVGLLITFQSPIDILLTPELILALFVPPLIFEAAFQLNVNELVRNLPRILLLAVPGVIITMLIVSLIISWTTPLSLPLALVFGSLIAATDPVAVVALFRALGAPKRLEILLEGESLFNDGTAIVIFHLMLTAALTGQSDLLQGLSEFIAVAVGGTAIGLVLGLAISRLIARVDDYLIETTLTTVLAFGSYVIAERLHFSGVLAVAAAGLVNGNIGPRGMSPTTRIILFNFWEYIAFLVNSFVFLLIGVQVNIPELLAAWQPVLWAILAVLIARVVTVYGLNWVGNHFAQPIPLRWQHILTWGGLRGAISLALVLSLPMALGDDRALLRVMTFGVALFTLIIQGTTISAFMRRLGIVTRTEAQIEYEMQHARMATLRAAETHLDRLHREGLLSTHIWKTIKAELSGRIQVLATAVSDALRANPTLEAEELDTIRRELLRVQRATLLDLRRDGFISEEVLERLTAEVDAELAGEMPTIAPPLERIGIPEDIEAQADIEIHEEKTEREEERL